MLICLKVSQRDLVDSIHNSIATASCLLKYCSGLIMNNNIFLRRDRHGNTRCSQEFA